MEKKYMCYITYAVPVDELPEFNMLMQKKEEASPPVFLSGGTIPSTFVPEWFYAGGFPEDDVD